MIHTPQILALLLVITTFHGLIVEAWPTSALNQRPNDTNRTNNPRTNSQVSVAGLQSIDNSYKTLTESNLFHTNQMPTRETSTSKHSPSSQISERELFTTPKDSGLNRAVGAATKRTDTMITHPRDNAYKNYTGAYSVPNYSEFDSSSEGSGLGPQPAWKHRNPKQDDTEDSGDDDSDNDEDYDYRDSLDSGSGLGLIRSTTARPDRARSEPSPPNGSDKMHPNDPYSPFRPPIVLFDADQKATTKTSTPSEMTTRQVDISTTRAPIRVPSTTSAPVSPSTTFFPKTSPSTTTSRNLVVSTTKNNGTRAEVDYDYEDENEDDDSIDSSAFEDNEPNETVTTSKLPARQHTNSSINTQTSHSNDGYNSIGTETTKLPASHGANSTNQLAQPIPRVTESLFDHNQRHTTSKPNSQTMANKPAITKPTVASQPSRPGAHQFDDLDEEERAPDVDEEEEEEEEEEEDEEGHDDDIEDSDRDENEPILGLEPPKHSGKVNATQHSRPSQNTDSRPSSSSTTQQPRPSTSKPTPSSSQTQYNLYDLMPSTHNPIVIPANVVPNQISVPIFTSTTASPTSPRVFMTSNPPKPILVSTTIASQPVLGQPTRVPTVSPAYRPTPGSDTSRTTTSTIPSIRSPPTHVTTTTGISNNRRPHDNGDTLTKQIYEKALEVYQEADKTVRAAWQAVWPPNINFDSSAVEPLLNQPLFFMRK